MDCRKRIDCKFLDERISKLISSNVIYMVRRCVISFQ